MKTRDQASESAEQTAQIEKEKGSTRHFDLNGQADEDANKTHEIEEAKGKPGGAL